MPCIWDVVFEQYKNKAGGCPKTWFSEIRMSYGDAGPQHNNIQLCQIISNVCSNCIKFMFELYQIVEQYNNIQLFQIVLNLCSNCIKCMFKLYRLVLNCTTIQQYNIIQLFNIVSHLYSNCTTIQQYTIVQNCITFSV